MSMDPSKIPEACYDKCVTDVIAGSTCTAEDGDCITDDICDVSWSQPALPSPDPVMTGLDLEREDSVAHP